MDTHTKQECMLQDAQLLVTRAQEQWQVQDDVGKGGRGKITEGPTAANKDLGL